MPILEYHLVKGSYSDSQIGELVVRSSEYYCTVLRSPVERVRVFVHQHEPQHTVVAGRLVADGSPPAPYFHFLVLQGRPLDECHRLLEGFTDLIVEVLGADRSLIRGACWPVDAQYWAIGGVPASVTRASEIAARAQSADSV